MSLPELFRRLLPVLRPWLRWGARLAVVLFFCAGLLILVGRYYLMPEVAHQRESIEQRMSAAIGLPVKITELAAGWPGLYPRLEVNGLEISDPQGRPALTLDRVDIEIGWSSLWHLRPILHRLEIIAPTLEVRRRADGNLAIAGLTIQGESDGSFANWLLEQGRIAVRKARIVWYDELRAAPPLELQELDCELTNSLRHHRFGLTATPPAAVASHLDVRGDFVGHDINDPAAWHGELYADLERADLAAWQPWIDLPFEWSRGNGGVRLWLDFAEMQPQQVTLDVRLDDAALRLRKDLPRIELRHLAGRLRGGRTRNGFAGEIRRLEMATQDGIVVAPTDARLSVTTGDRAGGDFKANGLDLGALAALAGHLPLPPEVHARLQEFAPRGRLADLAFDWRGDIAAPQGWHAKARFEELALAAYHELPGFSGISGALEGSDASGSIHLSSRNASFELPTVFADPRLELASLEADAGWKGGNGAMEFKLTRMQFHNEDAHGEASGSYGYKGSGLGEIDLTAKLTNAAGKAVWRYMPLVVNKDARDWLRMAITGGHADSATLRLRGPLDRFPFKDGKDGIFQVKGDFRGATLDYAPGWPVITDIQGDLLFEGVRMLIRAQHGTLMGVDLSGVEAEIADLEAPEELLTIKGKAHGMTQQFFDFIEASPVGARIDHFTEPMRATGKGELDLGLTLPLRHIADSLVQGRYAFADNQIRVLPELPPFNAAQGDVAFTSNRLIAKGLRARWGGAPVTLDINTLAGGAVKVDARGTLSAKGLRQEFGLPVFDLLAGEATWRGAVTVKKPGAEVHVESTLDGLSSQLPEPLGKAPRATLPLKVDGRIDAQKDDWNVTLGGQLAAHLQQQAGQWRGRVALGNNAAKTVAGTPPAKGVALSVVQPKLDADVWRDVMTRSTPAAGSATVAASTAAGSSNSPPAVQLAAVDLKSAEVLLAGRSFHDVQISATRDARWRIGIDSREAQGQLNWEDVGAGRITGRLAYLVVPASEGAGSAETDSPDTTTRELPSVSLVIDRFQLGERPLGEVNLAAENREGIWLAKFDMKNEAARLTGDGRWRPLRGTTETAVNFKLDVTDAEKLLARLKLSDAIRRGEVQLEGSLNWSGLPFVPDMASLSGQVKLAAEKGQFKKLEPGVGRLLGVLSLQSLPRRITLDFRDIFSDGFAFDSIGGQASIKQGVMTTEQLSIRGPAAKILLAGNVNLAAETQDINVRVRPAIGETIAVGAMLAHPVVGAAAWVAQKILNDPLDQVFAYEYAVTGSWSDPKVDKLSQPPPVPPVPPVTPAAPASSNPAGEVSPPASSTPASSTPAPEPAPRSGS